MNEMETVENFWEDFLRKDLNDLPPETIPFLKDCFYKGALAATLLSMVSPLVVRREIKTFMGINCDEQNIP